jgi:hypothetical protein
MTRNRNYVKPKPTPARDAHIETLSNDQKIGAYRAFSAWLIAATPFQFVASFLLSTTIWTAYASQAPFIVWLIPIIAMTWLWGRALLWR